MLLTNNRGGMARLCVDLGRVNSKYDCVLGANLHPTVPVDRHVLVKRLRVWVNADGFLSSLDFKNLSSFTPGSPAIWQFIANGGDGRTVEIELRAEMLADKNTVVFSFRRPTEKLARGKQLPDEADVRITVRVDIEDRNFHSETKRNGGADCHFLRIPGNCRRRARAARVLPSRPPATGSCASLRTAATIIRNPSGARTSPTRSNRHVVRPAAAMPTAPAGSNSRWRKADKSRSPPRRNWRTPTGERPKAKADDSQSDFAAQLEYAARQFVVHRDERKTVIAGYPWFLDWGRDSLICARGLLAAGMVDEVRQILLTFARFEKDGTLPNTINGNDVSNRDTTDAPLWFAVVCEELSAIKNSKLKTNFTPPRRMKTAAPSSTSW